MDPSVSSTPSSSSSSSPVVEKLQELLEMGPIEFEITILPSSISSSNAATTADDDDDSSQKGVEVAVLSLEESLVLVEGKYLGMDARSLPWMTREIRKDYWTWKKQLIADFGGFSPSNSEKIMMKKGDDENQQLLLFLLNKLLVTTRCLLLVNPDHATAWADRRRCLLALQKSSDNDCCCCYWSEELKFINLLMTQHSKAPSSWGHRKYVLQQILQSKGPIALPIDNDNNDQSSSSATTTVAANGQPTTTTTTTPLSYYYQIIQDEIDICTKVAEQYPKNYYAWTHRRYLWSLECFLIVPNTSTNTTASSRINHHELKTKLLETEFITMHHWMEHHISDHSAVHYQCQIIEIWMEHAASLNNDDEELMLKIAKNSLNNVHELLNRHPDHEVLWILRRIVLRILMDQSSSKRHNKTGIGGDDDDNKNNNKIRSFVTKDVNDVYSELLLLQESDSIQETTTTTMNNNKSVHAWSFLAWCMVQFDFCFPAEQLTKVLASLQSDPRICHRMWIAKDNEGK